MHKHYNKCMTYARMCGLEMHNFVTKDEQSHNGYAG